MVDCTILSMPSEEIACKIHCLEDIALDAVL